jgi:hypothetical protein
MTHQGEAAPQDDMQQKAAHLANNTEALGRIAESTPTTDHQPGTIAAAPREDIADPPKKNDGRIVPRFIHPCIPATRDDLDAIKANLTKEPWKSGYAILANDGRSQATYKMRGPRAEVTRNPDLNLYEWTEDMIAMYNLARMWYFTKKPAYAQRSRDILIAWATTQKSFSGQESGLALGDFAVRYAGGASILRGTWPGWTDNDTRVVKKYFANVLWAGTSATTIIPGPANKGSLNLVAGLAIATFCDDVDRFNHIINTFRTYPASGLSNMLATGQMGETGRDGGHSYGDLLCDSLIAEIAWKQGIDLYSELDNRLLACGEYYARNRFMNDNPFVPFGSVDYHYWVNAYGPYTANRAAFYLLQNAYENRKNLPTPWMDRKLQEDQPVDVDNFMYAKLADTSTATPLPPPTFPPTSLASSGLAMTTLGSQTSGRGASYAKGVWSVTGLGNGGWSDTEDDCQFVFKPMTGDCAMLAQVTSLSASGKGNRRAGLLLRDTLTARAANRAWAGLAHATPEQTTPDATILLEDYLTGWLHNWGGSYFAKRSQALPSGIPYWLKIERRGRLITTLASHDGTSWSPMCCSEYDNLPSTLYLGLFVSSGTKEPATATFAHVAFTGGTGGLVQTPAAPDALLASGSNKDITVRWLPSFGATSYDVFRSTTPGRGYVAIAENLGAAKTSYVDKTASAGITYSYVVRAKNTAGISPYSPAFNAALIFPALVNIATEGTATASFNGDSDQEGANKAFDQNPGSKWFGYQSPAGWICYDFGAGNAQVIKRYTLNSADVAERDPKSWQFQASQDGISWITLDSQDNQSFARRMQMNTYDIRNVAAYRFYRLNITATNGAPGVAIAELGLWSDVIRRGRD